MDKVIFCIDLKSFYASVECVDRNLDPFLVNLAVCDVSRGNGSIILAISPRLKQYGIPSRLRIFELPKIDDIIFAKPRMKRYLEVSSKIVSLYLDYVNIDDLHVYSIDECFLDFTHYMSFYNCSPIELATRIKDEIYSRFHLHVTIGISHNMFLAKVCMDIEAKHNDNQIAFWKEEDIKNKLWKISSLDKMWGIGKGYKQKLNRLGIYNVGDLATYPQEKLKEKFGIKGEELSLLANGIDDSNIRNKYIPNDSSITSGQVFFKDYSKEEILLIIKEMMDDLVLRLYETFSTCKEVSLSIGYSKNIKGGLNKHQILPFATNDLTYLRDVMLSLAKTYIDDKPIRNISLSLGKLQSSSFIMGNIFYSIEKQTKQRNLLKTISRIRKSYGNNSVLRLSSKLDCSTIYQKHNQIGGHAK